MLNRESALPLSDLIQQAKTAIVLITSNPTYDDVASALALALSLREAGKDVQVGCSAPMRVEFTHLVGVDQIKEKVGNRNLQISFDYVDGAVESVSYGISEDKKTLNLYIMPKSGEKPLDASDVQFRYVGADADIVFIIGARSMQDLSQVYEAEKEFFDAAYTIALNKKPVQTFARMHLDAGGQTCLAEGVAQFLSGLEQEPMDDIATNLLSSIELATKRFQSLNMSAETFELVGRLLRNGAKRSPNNPVFSEAHKQAERFMPVPPTTAVPSSSTPLFADALKKAQSKQNSVIPSLKKEENSTNRAGQTKQQVHHHKKRVVQNPPAEWLQPKVFTGASQVE